MHRKCIENQTKTHTTQRSVWRFSFICSLPLSLANGSFHYTAIIHSVFMFLYARESRCLNSTLQNIWTMCEFNFNAICTSGARDLFERLHAIFFYAHETVEMEKNCQR